MTETVTISFVDPQAGASMAWVRSEKFLPGEPVVGITLGNASGGRSTEVFLPAADAAKFARAVLAAAEKDGRASRMLPQSRQIGGIIGPY